MLYSMSYECAYYCLWYLVGIYGYIWVYKGKVYGQRPMSDKKGSYNK